MCLIIDANCFACVFNPHAKEHARFVPVYDWLLHGQNARLIYGGTKYKTELNFRNNHYRALLAEFERKGRLRPMPDKEVDKVAKRVKILVGNSPDFDDEHIVALVIVSKCCVVCSNDKRSFPYLKRRSLYPKGLKPPKIYQALRNATLCCNKHIVDVCR